MSYTFRTLLYEVSDGYGLVTLSRPEALNAITPQMLEDLRAVTVAAQSDPAVGALIVTGAGDRAFCSGMDLRAFQQRSESATPLDTRAQRQQSAPHPLASFSKPIIAAVNGLAYGGGLELCLLCDLVVAAERARFAAAEVARGLMPGNGATQRLPRKIGLTRALEMLLTGQPIDSAKALRVGLVNDVLPDDHLLAGAKRLAAAIAANGPVAVRLIKEAATRGVEMTLDQGLQLETDLLAHVQGTADAKEGVRAFLEKRKPVWTGR